MEERKYLGIDYGESRIGLATASSLARIASPLKIVGPDQDSRSEILNMIGDADIVVVGVPRDMNGEYGEMSARVRGWYDGLVLDARSAGHPADFALFDETLSSVRARELASDMGRSDKDHIDDVAAAIILQDYLDQGV